MNLSLLPKEVMAQLIAAAPDNIPEWFEHDEPERPNPPAMMNYKLECGEEPIINRWLSNPCYDLADAEDEDEEITFSMEAFRFEQDHLTFLRERSEWPKQNEAARYFQWRVFYAQSLATLICDQEEING